MPFTAFPGIPFGGYKQSGFGRELGIETLELYLETKSVLVSNELRSLSTRSRRRRVEGDCAFPAGASRPPVSQGRSM